MDLDNNLPIVALIVYTSILILQRTSKQLDSKESFEAAKINKEDNEYNEDNKETPLMERKGPSMRDSYKESLLGLRPPWIREEASFPIYGNISLVLSKAIHIFGPFKN